MLFLPLLLAPSVASKSLERRAATTYLSRLLSLKVGETVYIGAMNHTKRIYATPFCKAGSISSIVVDHICTGKNSFRNVCVHVGPERELPRRVILHRTPNVGLTRWRRQKVGLSGLVHVWNLGSIFCLK